MSDFSYMPMLGALGVSQEGVGPHDSTVTAGPILDDGTITGSATIDVGGRGGTRHPQTSAPGTGGKFAGLDWRTIAAIGGVIALGGLAYWVYRTKFAGKKKGRKGRGRPRRRR